MSIGEILTATIGGIFLLFALMVLAGFVGAIIETGMHDEEEDE